MAGPCVTLPRPVHQARTLAHWLIARREASLSYGEADPRYGILPGTDEGDDFKADKYKCV